MKDFNSGLTRNIRVLTRSTTHRDVPFWETETKTSPEGEASWEKYMQILQDWFKAGKWRKLFLQSGCCWFYLTQPSSHHFIRIKDQVSMFTGSLTTSSSSTQQLFFSRLPYGQQPSFYHFLLMWGHKISSSLKKTQAVELWNVFCAFVSLWALRCLPQAWKDRTQRNAKWGHTMTHILSSSQPGAGCTQIPCQHLVMKPVTERFADPNITETWHDFLQNHEFIFICTT